MRHIQSNRYLSLFLWNWQPKHDKLGQGHWQALAENPSSYGWLPCTTLSFLQFASKSQERRLQHKRNFQASHQSQTRRQQICNNLWQERGAEQQGESLEETLLTLWRQQKTGFQQVARREGLGPPIPLSTAHYTNAVAFCEFSMCQRQQDQTKGSEILKQTSFDWVSGMVSLHPRMKLPVLSPKTSGDSNRLPLSDFHSFLHFLFSMASK